MNSENIEENIKYKGSDIYYQEDEEEILYVVIEVGEGYEQQLSPGTEYELTGLDTKSPVLKLNEKEYIGTYEDLLGTYLIFDKYKDSNKLTYKCRTHKKLIFNKKIKDE